jgi:NitT/TauT family transport system ATP-binding protein
LPFGHAPLGSSDMSASGGNIRNASHHPGLRVESLNFAYGGVTILQDINLSVREGEFVCVLGPSGCGKTTLLRLLAGLEQPSSGSLSWNGVPIAGPSLERGVVFQDYSLFPWMTLRRNITVALAKTHPGTNRKWQADLANEFLELVGLTDSAGKYPFELSGGMRQRGAIARTLALGSPVLLMDEPFGALDPVNRARLQDLVLDVWSRTEPRKTVIFVTHDIDEAIHLSDRVVMLGTSPGRIIHERDVPIARPRHRRELVRLPEVFALREQIAGRFNQDMLQRIEAAEIVGGDGEGI